jgi:hypothetical protein
MNQEKGEVGGGAGTACLAEDRARMDRTLHTDFSHLKPVEKSKKHQLNTFKNCIDLQN